MKKSNKKVIIGIISIFLIAIIGVAYAYYSYVYTGEQNEIVTGQIYMNYEETSIISLTNVWPETQEQALARTDKNGVFEFSITGLNTSDKPVYYEIDLLDGGIATGKTEQSNKILPEHVKIYLERDGEVLVDGVSYEDFNNRKIYVDTIPANTTSNIEHRYLLRIWIDENVTISDTDPNADYTTSEWNDSYASLKVRVIGNFDYKELATDASCFEYKVIEEKALINTEYLDITLDTSEEKVNTCVTYNMELGLTTDSAEAKAFCEGTGLIDGVNIRHVVDRNYDDELFLQELAVVQNIEPKTGNFNLNTSEQGINACKEFFLSSNFGEDLSDAKDGYESFCAGTGTVDGLFLTNVLSYASNMGGSDVISSFIYSNILIEVETSKSEIEITDYDETCGTDVAIPSYIEGLPVTSIGDVVAEGEVYNGVFSQKNLTSIKFPNTLKYIGIDAFSYNNITNVIIPESVINIMEYAFAFNPLVTVDIKNASVLGSYSFQRYENIETLKYGGTCRQLNLYQNVFYPESPKMIITSDSNSCEYTNIIAV